MFDIVATQDWANCQAVADVVVDDQVILAQVPFTHLLFLEKQLLDIQTLVEKLPVLDPAERCVTAGTWTTVKFSGAIPAARKNAMLDRVRALQDAVKSAREIANGLEVEKKKVGAKILKFIFPG